MRTSALAAPALLLAASWGLAYVEAPHTLGRCVHESSHILLLEVAKVNKEKGLIYYKKVQELKGKDARTEIKHNIGKRGFHEREWKTIMAWAEPGKKAVFFHNGGQSETCIGNYWYQCYHEGDWWGMTHAEPFLLRTFSGDVDKLAAAVPAIAAGKEVVVSCMADQNKDQFHHRKGKLQRLKASLKRLDYNAKRDFVAWGGDGDDVPETKTVVLLPESGPAWKFTPAAQATSAGTRWQQPDFDDSAWRRGKAPVGYGEPEIAKRTGSPVGEKGQAFLFRREFEVPAELLKTKGVTFRLCVASDDSAVVYLNGKAADQEEPAADHEFSYWNRDLEVPATLLRPGRNVVAALVRNRPNSSDLFLDMQISAEVPVPRKVPPKK